jgi:hypothetical protein
MSSEIDPAGSNQLARAGAGSSWMAFFGDESHVEGAVVDDRAAVELEFEIVPTTQFEVFEPFQTGRVAAAAPACQLEVVESFERPVVSDPEGKTARDVVSFGPEGVVDVFPVVSRSPSPDPSVDPEVVEGFASSVAVVVGAPLQVVGGLAELEIDSSLGGNESGAPVVRGDAPLQGLDGKGFVLRGPFLESHGVALQLDRPLEPIRSTGNLAIELELETSPSSLGARGDDASIESPTMAVSIPGDLVGIVLLEKIEIEFPLSIESDVQTRPVARALGLSPACGTRVAGQKRETERPDDDGPVAPVVQEIQIPPGESARSIQQCFVEGVGLVSDSNHKYGVVVIRILCENAPLVRCVTSRNGVHSTWEAEGERGM